MENVAKEERLLVKGGLTVSFGCLAMILHRIDAGR